MDNAELRWTMKRVAQAALRAGIHFAAGQHSRAHHEIEHIKLLLNEVELGSANQEADCLPYWEDDDE